MVHLPIFSEERVRSARPMGPATRVGFRVALVSMPCVAISHPSIQLGLLKSCVEQHGFGAETFHLNVDVAKHVGFVLYEILASHRGTQLGEWLFSVAAFGDAAPDPKDALVDDMKSVPVTPHELRALRREILPAFLDELAARTDWSRFALVGFTSTFQQNLASFALASRIKARHPGVRTVFGGANFEGEMGLELMRTVPCIDYVVVGEGEDALPELCAALHEGRDPAEVPGVASRTNGGIARPKARPLQHRMDDLPIPDYREYFDRIDALGAFPPEMRRLIEIPFESARGCWWGQKHHCTFCGLNGATMAFRSKSPARVAEELSVQARRHGIFGFEAVDNIVDASYVKTLFPALAAEDAGYSFFYEVKANLTRDQLRTFARAGVRRIQPGIESLSTRVLSLMRKGVTALQNVNLLRWSLHYGIDVGWNILWGFPTETPRDYAEQTALVKKLAHLTPPGGGGRVWLERFSPLFADRASFPARGVRPEASYAYAYPKEVDLEKVAYFFDYEFEDRLPDDAYAELRAAIDAWRAAWDSPARPTLTYRAAPGYVQIEDRRGGEPRVHHLVGAEAALHRACNDRPRTLAALCDREPSLRGARAEVERAAIDLVARDLLAEDGGHLLSLALPARRGD